MAEPIKVKIKALKVLRGEGGKKILINGTTMVLESTAKILVEKKQAELVVKG